MKTILAILIACATTHAEPMAPQTFCRATVAQVHDGDSILIQIDLGFKIQHGWVICRAADFDAWEVDRTRGQVEPFKSFSKSEWEREIEKGKAAREGLQKLLNTGTLYVTPDEQRDPYGRVRAKWYVQTRDELIEVAGWMKAKGYTRK